VLAIAVISVDDPFDAFFLDGRVDAAIPQNWKGLVELLTDH